MSEPNPSESLFIIWSSGDPEVARNLAFMYAHNSLLQGWWKRVRLIIWGPSARLSCEDPEIAERIKAMIRDGVEVWACLACADNYGLAEELKALGADVLYVGGPVTDMLKKGWKQLTF